MTAHPEPLIATMERDAQELRVCSGLKVTIAQARDRVCDSCGWVNWAHMLRCKSARGVN